jgi:hypothetical protein
LNTAGYFFFSPISTSARSVGNPTIRMILREILEQTTSRVI